MKYQPIRYERERSYLMPVAEAWRLRPTPITASAAHSAAWAAAVFGTAAVLLTGGLLIDVFRRR